MLLAAGRGERLRPLTDRIPKALVEVGGTPLIVRQVERLARAGFKELVVNCAHLGHLIEQRLGDGTEWGVRIAWSREPEALETAGGIAQALPLLGEAPFAVVNVDIVTDFDLWRLRPALDSLGAERDLAHLVLVDNPVHNPRGDFCLRGGRVQAGGEPRLTFSGVAAYHPRLFAGIPPGTKAALAPLLREAARRGQASGMHFRGYWLDVGTAERLAEAERHCATERGLHGS